MARSSNTARKSAPATKTAGKQKSGEVRQLIAKEKRDAIHQACIAAFGAQTHAQGARDQKKTLANMADRIKAAGVTPENIKAARESFHATLNALFGLPQPLRSSTKPASDPVARVLVEEMASAADITAEKYSAAKNNEERRAVTAAATKAMQRLIPRTGQAPRKAADIFEAAQSWVDRVRKDFTNFQPKSISDPQFKRLMQVILDEFQQAEGNVAS